MFRTIKRFYKASANIQVEFVVTGGVWGIMHAVTFVH
jgi:predicted Rossmann-fold nucleotide-binding protein